MCARTKVVFGKVDTVDDCPVVFEHDRHTFDGKLPEVELMMSPVGIYNDPFRKGRNKIVLCQLLFPDGTPPPVNTRVGCKTIMDKVKEHEPWFGFEQEYFITDNDGMPFGWNADGTYVEQDQEYHSNLCRGHQSGFERNLAESHLMACLYAGLKMYGMYREACAAMWEYQVGPCCGVEAGDQVFVSRYILKRLAEQFGVKVALVEPHLIQNTKMTNMLQPNFSTKDTRSDGGLLKLRQMAEKLKNKPQEQLLKHYDRNNGMDAAAKLIGKLFNPALTEVTVADGQKESCSIRIPTNVVLEGKGYLEERRVAADGDPYEVSRVIVVTVLLDE